MKSSTPTPMRKKLMYKKIWTTLLLAIMLSVTPMTLHAADTKLSALPSATLTDGDELYVNDGGTSTKATVAELRTILIAKGFHALDITSLREIGVDTANEIGNVADGAAKGSGGILAADTTPSLKRVNLATDKALVVNWPAANVDEVQFPMFPMPMDLDETADVTIHLIMDMAGATDTPTVDVQVFDGVGDTEMGGPTAALSGTAQELTVTIANANISGNPLGYFSISLVPGAHGTDAMRLRAAWIEYTRKAPS